jgi:hypothetical protein
MRDAKLARYPTHTAVTRMAAGHARAGAPGRSALAIGLLAERLAVVARQMLGHDRPGDEMSDDHGPSVTHTSELAEGKHPWLAPRRTALLASALLLVVVIPLPWTVWAAPLAAPVFVYALMSLPTSRERTLALLSSGLAVVAPAVFLLVFA